MPQFQWFLMPDLIIAYPPYIQTTTEALQKDDSNNVTKLDIFH